MNVWNRFQNVTQCNCDIKYEFYGVVMTRKRINIANTIEYMQDILVELNSRQDNNDSSNGCINYLSVSTSAELCDRIAKEAIMLKNHWYT